MKNKLQKYALLAEIIGGLGIIASLVFVGIQVNQTAEETALNTRQIQGMTFLELSGRISDLNILFAQNPEIYEAILLAQSNSELNEDQRLRAISILRFLFRYGETAYIQYENEIINEDQLMSLISPVIMNMRNDLGMRTFEGTPLSEEYKRYMFSMVGE